METESPAHEEILAATVWQRVVYQGGRHLSLCLVSQTKKQLQAGDAGPGMYLSW